MARRLIIATDSRQMTADLRNRITQLLESRGWQVWHWFEDLWLVTNVDDIENVELIRDELVSVRDPKILVMVFDGDKGIHAGFIPSKSIPWLDNFWKPARKL